MLYNGSTLSPRSTVHGLHLQDDQVGDVHLTLRMRGGVNLCGSSVQCTQEEAAAAEEAHTGVGAFLAEDLTRH